MIDLQDFHGKTLLYTRATERKFKRYVLSPDAGPLKSDFFFTGGKRRMNIGNRAIKLNRFTDVGRFFHTQTTSGQAARQHAGPG